MFHIRKQQLQAFEEARLPEFEDIMVGHLKDFSPALSGSLGDAGMRVVIRTAMQRAAKHGFTLRGPVRFYVETTILLGIDFDTDPQYPWASETLAGTRIRDQMQRADRLYEQLIEFRDAVGGPHLAYSNRALHALKGAALEAGSSSTSDFPEVLLRRMREVYPEKVEYVGEVALRKLIARAFEEARSFSILTGSGVSLFLGLMFMVGHGCANDSAFPWIASSLRNSATRDPEKRIERLYSKALTYLDYVLGPPERR